MISPLKIALIQLRVGADKLENIARARQQIIKAHSSGGVKLVALPVRVHI